MPLLCVKPEWQNNLYVWLGNKSKKDAMDFIGKTSWVDIVIGNPKSMDHYKHKKNNFNSEKLKKMGFVGIYRTSDRKLTGSQQFPRKENL